MDELGLVVGTLVLIAILSISVVVIGDYLTYRDLQRRLKEQRQRRKNAGL